MIERGRTVIGAAAVSLIHPDHVHSCGHSLGSNSRHVGGVAGAFETVDNQHRETVLPVGLPVAVTEHLDARFHSNKLCLGRRNLDGAGKKEAAQRLKMASAQKTARLKGRLLVLRRPHPFILNGCFREWNHANF